MSVGGWERGISGALERLAELEDRSAQVASPGRGRVPERAALGVGVEMNAILAGEAKLEPARLGDQPLVDMRLHGLRRSTATTISTWLVCGNISNVSMARGS